MASQCPDLQLHTSFFTHGSLLVICNLINNKATELAEVYSSDTTEITIFDAHHKEISVWSKVSFWKSNKMMSMSPGMRFLTVTKQHMQSMQLPGTTEGAKVYFVSRHVHSMSQLFCIIVGNIVKFGHVCSLYLQ